jgi:hypothetical protein
MPDIEAVDSSIDIYLCGEQAGEVRGKVCLYLDKDIHEHFLLRSVGKVATSIRSHKIATALIDMELSIPSTSGHVLRVVKGIGSSNLMLDLSIKGSGAIRSVVTSIGRAHIAMKGEPFSPSPSRVLTPIYTTKDLKILLSHWGSFIPEISMPVLNIESKQAFDSQKKISIEVLKEYTTSMDYIGDRRNWLVARVLYEGCPVMYVCNTGWQGSTYPTRYVLDRDRYQYMNFYLFTLMQGDKGSNDYSSLSGMMSDRQRIVQADPSPSLRDLPKAIREVMIQVGDIHG